MKKKKGKRYLIYTFYILAIFVSVFLSIRFTYKNVIDDVISTVTYMVQGDTKYKVYYEKNNYYTDDYYDQTTQENIKLTKNSYTLLVIKEALEFFIKQNSKKTFKLDSPAVTLKRLEFLKEDLSQPVKIALFYHYLMWFLNRQKVNKDYVNNSIYSVSTSKNLLVTRMAYYTGLTDNINFLQKDAYYLRTYISGYEDNKVNTLNAYYDMTDEFQFLLEMMQKI